MRVLLYLEDIVCFLVQVYVQNTFEKINSVPSQTLTWIFVSY